jgi:hypothetical protein
VWGLGDGALGGETSSHPNNGVGVTGIGGAPDGSGGVFVATGAGDGVTGSGATTGAGVLGLGSTSGPGVQGDGGTTGPGVVGNGGTNNGIGGKFTSRGTGAGVKAIGNALGTGLALDVHGRAQFTRSGLVSLSAAGTSVTTPAVPGGLTANSHVLATVQTDVGTVAVRAAVPHTTTGKITIHLTAQAPAGTEVAYFVFG